ncbi:7706_t:CDS:2 [Entrophospora sp. SA101]|nr:7706_t:CDS:2 [Entrophospora sp. SA101]
MFLNGSGSLEIESNDNFENRVNHYLESEDCNLEYGNNDVEIEDDLNTNNDNVHFFYDAK